MWRTPKHIKHRDLRPNKTLYKPLVAYQTQKLVKSHDRKYVPVEDLEHKSCHLYT